MYTLNRYHVYIIKTLLKNAEYIWRVLYCYYTLIIRCWVFIFIHFNREALINFTLSLINNMLASNKLHLKMLN